MIRKLIAMAFIVLMVSPAYAALPRSGVSSFPDTPHDELKAFFDTLRNPKRGNSSCCGNPDPDCRPVNEFKSEDINGVRVYRALIERRYFVESDWSATTWQQRFGNVDEVWRVMPESAVFSRPDNPTGKSIVCYSLNLDEFYCFVPWESGT